MSADTVITRHKGGTKETEVRASELRVPDLWHVFQAMKTDPNYGKRAADAVAECWQLCHDLLRHIKETP